MAFRVSPELPEPAVRAAVGVAGKAGMAAPFFLPRQPEAGRPVVRPATGLRPLVAEAAVVAAEVVTPKKAMAVAGAVAVVVAAVQPWRLQALMSSPRMAAAGAAQVPMGWP